MFGGAIEQQTEKIGTFAEAKGDKFVNVDTSILTSVFDKVNKDSIIQSSRYVKSTSRDLNTGILDFELKLASDEYIRFSNAYVVLKVDLRAANAVIAEATTVNAECAPYYLKQAELRLNNSKAEYLEDAGHILFHKALVMKSKGHNMSFLSGMGMFLDTISDQSPERQTIASVAAFLPGNVADATTSEFVNAAGVYSKVRNDGAVRTKKWLVTTDTTAYTQYVIPLTFLFDSLRSAQDYCIPLSEFRIILHTITNIGNYLKTQGVAINLATDFVIKEAYLDLEIVKLNALYESKMQLFKNKESILIPYTKWYLDGDTNITGYVNKTYRQTFQSVMNYYGRIIDVTTGSEAKNRQTYSFPNRFSKIVARVGGDQVLSSEFSNTVTDDEKYKDVSAAWRHFLTCVNADSVDHKDIFMNYNDFVRMHFIIAGSLGKNYSLSMGNFYKLNSINEQVELTLTFDAAVGANKQIISIWEMAGLLQLTPTTCQQLLNPSY